MALVMMVAACSTSSSPTAQASQLAHSAPSPTALSGDLPVWPVNANVGTENHPQYTGGFLHFPGGIFQRDPRAEMMEECLVFNGVCSFYPRMRTAVQPHLFGDSWVSTYDLAARRWLPVPRSQVSDDGFRYAYRELLPDANPPVVVGMSRPLAGVRLHLVDLRTGSDRVVYSDNGTLLYNIAGLAQQYVFMTSCDANREEGCWGRLWRMDTATGELTKVSDRQGWWVIGGGGGWTVTCSAPHYAPGDTRVPPPDTCFWGLPENQPDLLLRVDLLTGAEETWSRMPGVALVGIGGDGLPLIKLNGAGVSVLLRVSAPGQTERLFSVPLDRLNPGAGVEGPVVADRNGIWLSVIDRGPQPHALSPAIAEGVYLLTKSSGRKVSDFRGMAVGPLN